MVKIQIGLCGNQDTQISTDYDGIIIDDGMGLVNIPSEWVIHEKIRLSPKCKYPILPWYFRLIPKEKLLSIIHKMLK